MSTEGVVCVITSSIFASASSGDILSSEANLGGGCTGERAVRSRWNERSSISMGHSDSFAFSQDDERSAVVNELVRGDGSGGLLFELRRQLSL